MCKDCKDSDIREQILPIRPTEEMGVPEIRELAGMALGAASVCWSKPSEGVFQSDRVAQILDDLCRAIEQHVDNQIAERKKEWEDRQTQSDRASQSQTRPLIRFDSYRRNGGC